MQKGLRWAVFLAIMVALNVVVWEPADPWPRSFNEVLLENLIGGTVIYLCVFPQ